MTTHKTLKRRVRARMDKTGERYTAARRNVTAGANATGPAATAKPVASRAASGLRRGRPQGDGTWLGRVVRHPRRRRRGWLEAPGHRPLGGRRARDLGLVGAERHGRLRASARAARRARAAVGLLPQRDQDRPRARSNGCTRHSPIRRQRNDWLGHAVPRSVVDGTADRQPRLGRRFAGCRSLHGAGPGQVPGGTPAGSAARRRGGRGAAGVLAAAPRGPEAAVGGRANARLSRLGGRRRHFWMPAPQLLDITRHERQYSAVCRNRALKRKPGSGSARRPRCSASPSRRSGAGRPKAA